MPLSSERARFWRRLLSVSLLLAVVIVTSLSWYGYRWLHGELSIAPDGYQYELRAGGTLSRLAHDLNAAGVLRHPRLLIGYARLAGQTSVKAGEYQFHQGDTPLSLLDKLNRAEVITYAVTLVEGWTFRQALNQVQSSNKIVVQLRDDAALDQFLASLELEGGHPEGWFFPDTYRYVGGMSDRDVLLQAHRRMRDVLASEWLERASDLPYETPYEALIMASIVERETGLESERQQIAGVFVRRLQRNMRLQTDPTVIYGLGDQYDGNIRRGHLSQRTPYNTYVIRGLPPTPIALPGRDAIYAALHPDDGDALYFVARGDGSHQFSATLEEHNRAVREYQVRRRAVNYQSAPQISTDVPPSGDNVESDSPEAGGIDP